MTWRLVRWYLLDTLSVSASVVTTFSPVLFPHPLSSSYSPPCIILVLSPSLISFSVYSFSSSLFFCCLCCCSSSSSNFWLIFLFTLQFFLLCYVFSWKLYFVVGTAILGLFLVRLPLIIVYLLFNIELRITLTKVKHYHTALVLFHFVLLALFFLLLWVSPTILFRCYFSVAIIAKLFSLYWSRYSILDQVQIVVLLFFCCSWHQYFSPYLY